MSKPIIAVDIDDVLTYSAKHIVEFGNREFGFSHAADDFDENILALWQMNHDDGEAAVIKYLTTGRLEDIEVVTEALPALRELKKHFQLIALTSRRDIIKQLTKAYIDEHFPDVFEAVYHSGIYGKGAKDAHQHTKTEMLQEIGASYLIDDQLKHCIGAASSGVQAVLYGEYGWNKSDEELPAGIIRCRDWKEVEEYFDGRDD